MTSRSDSWRAREGSTTLQPGPSGGHSRPGEPAADRATAAGWLAATERTRGRLAEARRLDRLAAQLDGTGAAALRPVLNDVWTAVYLGVRAGARRSATRQPDGGAGLCRAGGDQPALR